MKPHQCYGGLVLLLLTWVHVVRGGAPKHGDVGSPEHICVRAKTSFSLKERFKRALILDSEHHTRQKRLIHWRFKFPYGSNFEIKWGINWVVPTEPKYFTRLQIALPINRALPTYLVDDVYTPPFASLYGIKGRENRHSADERDDEHEEYPEDEDEYDDDDSLEDSHADKNKEVKSKRKEKASSKKKKKESAKRKKIAEEEKKEESRRTKRSLHVTDRKDAYDAIEGIFKNFGLPGRACLQRTVCEVADAPLHFGIVGDCLNLMLTPSAASLSASSDDLAELSDYLDAEEAGRQMGMCHENYSECPSSLFEMVPLVAHRILHFESV